MKIIKRFQETMYMVRFVKRNTDYMLMQFIEPSTGKRHNYVPDSHPKSYRDCCDIICVFHVHEKKIPSFITRFNHYWNFYK